MSEGVNKLSCGVCHAYLFEDDDVVYCPVCGAPHHRDCYKSLGHCAYEDKHGTAGQYKKPDLNSETANEQPKNTEVTCGVCGAHYSALEPVCPECSAPNTENGGVFAGFDFLGGVPKDLDLGEGVRAVEAQRFVFTNTRRYIPRFAEVKLGKKAGWNWFSFLIPCGWFLSRKMYKAGIITGILSVCFSMLTLPFSQAISHYDIASMGGYNELISTIVSDYSKIGVSVIVLFLAGSALQLLLRVICAVFGDKIYRDYAIKTISDIKNNSDDIDYDYRKRGGANFFLLLAGLFAVQYLPMIIATLLN